MEERSKARKGDSENQSAGWIVCPCNNCSGNLEFDSEHAGETVACPHCGMDTVLLVPRTTPVSASRTARWSLPEILAPVSAVVVVLLLVLYSVHHRREQQREIEEIEARLNKIPKEDLIARTERFEVEARRELTNCCSQETVGFQRIVRYEINGLGGDNPDKWRGDADVEFVNKLGGIERTNLPLIFRIPLKDSPWYTTDDWHVACMLDYVEIGKRETAAFNRKLDEISHGR